MANATIVDLKWIVPVSPYRNSTVVGTVQDVANHLKIVDPAAYDALEKSIDEAVAAPLPQRPAGGVSHSAKNEPENYTTTEFACGAYPLNANGIRIKQGIEYLRRVPSQSTNLPSMFPVCLQTHSVSRVYIILFGC
jgi:hypothetical protein